MRFARNRRLRPAAAGLGLLLAALSGAPGVSAKPALVPQSAGERSEYQFTSLTESPRGQQKQSWTLALVRADKGALDIALSSQTAPSERYSGWLQRDGSVAVRAAADNAVGLYVVRHYNEVVALLAGAPEAPKAGDTWRAQLDVPLPQGGSTRVGVLVKVATAGDDGFVLEADGDAKVSLSPPGGASGSGGPDGTRAPASGALGGTSSSATQPSGGPGGAPGAGPGMLGGPPVSGGPGGVYSSGSAGPAGTEVGGHAGPQITLSVHAAASFAKGKFTSAEGTLRGLGGGPDDATTVTAWSLTGTQ